MKEGSSKAFPKISRKVGYFKEDSSRSFNRFLSNSWRSIGQVGIGFLNVLPKLGKTVISFFGDLFTNLFHGIYEQQINKGKAEKVIIGFFIIVGVVTLIATGITTFNELDEFTEKPVIEQTEKKPPKPLAKKRKKHHLK